MYYSVLNFLLYINTIFFILIFKNSSNNGIPFNITPIFIYILIYEYLFLILNG